MSQQDQARAEKPPTFSATTCAACGSAVGLLWIKGRSTLIETRVQEFEGSYLVRPHRCPGIRPASELPTPPARNTPLERHQPPRRRPPRR